MPSVTDRGLAAPPQTEPGTLTVYFAKEGDVAHDDVGGVNSSPAPTWPSSKFRVWQTPAAVPLRPAAGTQGS